MGMNYGVFSCCYFSCWKMNEVNTSERNKCKKRIYKNRVRFAITAFCGETNESLKKLSISLSYTKKYFFEFQRLISSHLINELEIQSSNTMCDSILWEWMRQQPVKDFMDKKAFFIIFIYSLIHMTDRNEDLHPRSSRCETWRNRQREDSPLGKTENRKFHLGRKIIIKNWAFITKTLNEKKREKREMKGKRKKEKEKEKETRSFLYVQFSTYWKCFLHKYWVTKKIWARENRFKTKNETFQFRAKPRRKNTEWTA